MKIAIDISQIVYGTGVSIYTENLVKNLLLIDTENEYKLFAGTLRQKSNINAFTKSLKGKYKSKVYPIPPSVAHLLWNKLHKLPIEKLVGDVDVFHSSDWTQPPSKARKITTIHDLVPVLYPNLSHPKIVSTQRARLAWVKKEVDIIIAPSNATKNDLVKLGFEKSKLKIIPEAPRPDLYISKTSDIDEIKRKYNISGNYYLAVGNNPRKNTKRIAEAFQKSHVRGEKLVILGHPQSIKNSYKNIMIIGHVSDDEIASFYSGAKALIYPSLYEGFGIPILDAYVCNTPVITSNYGSMKEVSGDAAILVDPEDIDSISNGINKAIKYKEQMIEKGMKRVKNFSWHINARETLKVYNTRI